MVLYLEGGMELKKFLAFILIISISLSLLVLSLEFNTYNKSYYLDSYEKYNVLETTGKSLEQLEVITEDIIEYLKGNGGNELLNPHFNEKEVLHMEDVVQLFDYARIIKYISITISILIIVYFILNKLYRFLAKTLSLGLFLNHAIIIFLIVLISTNFNKYFTIFHEIFFSNDLWILNPNTDLMIQMLPEPFFSTIGLRIGLFFLIFLAIIQIGAYLYIRKGVKYGGKVRKN